MSSHSPSSLTARRMPPVVEESDVIEAVAVSAPSAPMAPAEEETQDDPHTPSPAAQAPYSQPPAGSAEGFMAKMRPLLAAAHKAFTEHPAAAGESYSQHLLFTLGMGGRLMFAGLVIALHGLFPFMLTYTGSNQLKKCNKILSDRATKAQMPAESPLPYGDNI